MSVSLLRLISSPLLAGVSQPPVLPFLASSQSFLVVYRLPLPILDLGLSLSGPLDLYWIENNRNLLFYIL
jgi:hypothetical protein